MRIVKGYDELGRKVWRDEGPGQADSISLRGELVVGISQAELDRKSNRESKKRQERAA